MALASGTTGKNQRKKILINPGFQWRHAMVIGFVVFATSMIVSSLLYDLLHKQARLRASNPTMYTAQVTSVIITFSAIYSVITALGVGFWSFMATHRICGPLYVMRRYLAELAGGCLPKVRPLRRRDEFKEVHQTLAAAVDSLRITSMDHRAKLVGAISSLHSLESTSSGANLDSLHSIASQLDEINAQLCEFCGEMPPSTQGQPKQASPSQVLVEASV